MDPRTFLAEEFRSVEQALKETLRHDYGPLRSSEYFQECSSRLNEIRPALDLSQSLNKSEIAAYMRMLSALGSRISLIERSHLGESSWPFAETICNITDKLFQEKSLEGKSFSPIVHIIAEGMGYQIVNETLPLTGTRNIIVVAFPRQFKHHVLLHSIFGHELGHTAMNTAAQGAKIKLVAEIISSDGPLKDCQSILEWLKLVNAPNKIKAEIAAKKKYSFPEKSLTNWRIEIICDLFGLLLFGPSFAAAHRVLLEPLCQTPSDFNLETSTHPPYSIRRRVIVSAIKVLKWNIPVITPAGTIYDSENALINYITEDDEETWHSILSQSQLESAIAQISKIFEPHPTLAFKKPTPDVLTQLVGRLAKARPPVLESLSDDGVPKNSAVPTSHCLYAGWVYWFGRSALKEIPIDQHLRELSFLETNRLCDYAMLQQCAIDRMNASM